MAKITVSAWNDRKEEFDETELFVVVCPICNRTPTIVYGNDNNRGRCTCPVCETSGPSMLSQDEAVKAWNNLFSGKKSLKKKV